MPFDSGSVSFCVYHIPSGLPENYLEGISSRAAAPLEKVGAEPEVGFVGRHLLERRIDEETAFAGSFLSLYFRQSVRKIPRSLLVAECMQRELALMQAEDLSSLSRKKKKEIREEVEELMLKEMPPQLSGIPFVFDSDTNRLFIGATSLKQADAVTSLLIDAIEEEIIPATPEALAGQILDSSAGLRLDAIDFCGKDLGADENALGRDFLTWLWYAIEAEGASFIVPDLGEFEMALDGPLVMVAENVGSHESVLRKGLPTLSPEAHSALTAGKKLKMARLSLTRGDDIWTFTFDAENFIFKSVRLPEGEALERVAKFEERMMFLNDLYEAMSGIYATFIKSFYATEDDECIGKVREWVNTRQYQNPEML